MMGCKSVLKEQAMLDIDVSLFGALTSEQREVVLTHLEIKRYASGQRVFSQGGLPSEIYILASGSVNMVSEFDGISKIQASYSPGDTFGESAFIGIQSHIGTAVVHSDTGAEIWGLNRDALMALQECDSNLFSILMMNLAREVSRKYHASLGAM